MSREAAVLEVVVGGPSDVEGFCNVLISVVHAWNSAHSRTSGICLQPRHWSTDATPNLGDHPQRLINKELIDPGDILLCVFHGRLGRPTQSAESGTADEIEEFRKAGKPVMVYFCDAPVPQHLMNDEFQRLLAYKNKLEMAGLYSKFSNADDLREKASVYLARTINNLAGPLVGSVPPATPQVNGPTEKALNKVELDLSTNNIVNGWRQTIAQLRPILLEEGASNLVQAVPEIRQDFHALLGRVGEFVHVVPRTAIDANEYRQRALALIGDMRLAFDAIRHVFLADIYLKWLPSMRQTYELHNDSSAWEWPDEKQCQCHECKDYRRTRAQVLKQYRDRKAHKSANTSAATP